MVLIQRITFVSHVTNVTNVNVNVNINESNSAGCCTCGKWICLIFCLLLLLPVYALLMVILLPLCYVMWVCLPCMGKGKDAGSLCCLCCCCWPVGPVIAAVLMTIALMARSGMGMRKCLGI